MSASALSILEKRKVSEIVNGTIRMTKRLDWVLNLFKTRGGKTASLVEKHPAHGSLSTSVDGQGGSVCMCQ